MTDNRSLPERMFETGLVDLIPIIPPGASLAPTSKIAPGSVGKIPGRRLENGLWVGLNWRALQATLEDVREWQQWGANVGLRTDRFPSVDIDCAEESLAAIIEQAALAILGPAPIRVGNAPKRALAYGLASGALPFGRLRLWMKKGEQKYLVEILGAGQQYVVAGTHPKTLRPYEWSAEPSGDTLTGITLDQAKGFIAQMQETAAMLGYECSTEGDGSGLATRRGDQQGLLAPSLDELRQVVELLPNTNTLFPGRHDWLKVGAAIRAAAGEENEPEAADLFQLWSAKWEGNDIHEGNDPDYTREEFRRLKPPFAVGWSFLAEMARPYGYNDMTFTADMDTPAPTPAEDVPATFLSDQWLADKVVEAAGDRLRFCPKLEQWYVWSNGRWQPDAELLAEDTVKLELRKIAKWLGSWSGADGEVKNAEKKATEICSAGKVTAVSRLVKMDRAIAVSPESLDYDPWILNTPGGEVDLRTGKLQPPNPDHLCSRSTSVAPAYGETPHRWLRFLDEATNGDVELQGYLKRLAGYCLTGITKEQQYAFLHGDGGNGKGTTLKVLMGILATYHRDSPMETFIASNHDRHPTELAYLAGARFVTASETDAGRRWDEARLKRMTGGDPITARGMRENFFTYIPQFKLVFIGNQRPEIRTLDEAMRRRTHLVPFTFKPKVRDLDLDEKLRAEWPAVLAWMIEGCLEWQEKGLRPPASVLAATEEYFSEMDAIGQWIMEWTAETSEWIELQTLYDSWKEFANRQNEWPGKVQRLGQMLAGKGYRRRLAPKTRRAEIFGLKLRQNPLEGVK